MTRTGRAAPAASAPRHAPRRVDARVRARVVGGQVDGGDEAYQVVAAARADDGADGSGVASEQVGQRGQRGPGRDVRERVLPEQAQNARRVPLLGVVEIKIYILQALLGERFVQPQRRLGLGLGLGLGFPWSAGHHGLPACLLACSVNHTQTG